MKPRRFYRLRRALLALVAIAVLGASGAWLWTNREDDGTGSSRPLAAAGPPRAEVRERPDAKTPPPGIALISGHALRLRFADPPRGGVAFDLDTGEVVWRRHPLRPLPMASLTKIMTALIVVEDTTSSERVRINKTGTKFRGSGIGVLQRGQRPRVDALLHGLMLPSGNDAAVALAIHVAGSEGRFVRRMNLRARRLGLRCTHFSSSYGLEAGNRACPADLAALSRAAMREPRIARIVRRKQADVRFPMKGGRLYLNNTNPLLQSGYPGTIGLKTGYTERAGRCFVAVVKRGGRTWGVVLLHSPDPAGQAKRIVEAAVRREAKRN